MVGHCTSLLEGDYYCGVIIMRAYVGEEILCTLISLQLLQIDGFEAHFPFTGAYGPSWKSSGFSGEIVDITDRNYEMLRNEQLRRSGFFMCVNADDQIVSILNSRCKIVEPMVAIEFIIAQQGKRTQRDTHSIIPRSTPVRVTPQTTLAWSCSLVHDAVSSNIFRGTSMNLSPQEVVTKIHRCRCKWYIWIGLGGLYHNGTRPGSFYSRHVVHM